MIWVLKPIQPPYVVTQHHLLWQIKVLQIYPKSRSQLGKVYGERERPKRRWLDEVTEKNGTQTNGILNLATNNTEWRKTVS